MTSRRRPAGPAGRRLVGVGYDYQKDPIGFLRSAQQQYGDVHSMGPRTVVVHDPDLAHEVLARSDDFTPDLPRITTRRPPSAPKLDWARTRRAGWAGMTRAVTRRHDAATLGLLAEAVAAGADDAVPVLDVFTRWSCRTAVAFCLGTDARSTADLVAQRTRVADRLASTSLTYPSWWPSRDVRSMVRTTERLNADVQRQIAARRAQPHDEPHDLLDLVLAEAGDSLVDELVLRLIKANLLAADSTPGAALAWIVWELAQRPDLIDPVSTDPGYAEAVVREVLRLHPPIWLLARAVLRECDLDDWTLTADDRVVIPAYLIHRDPRWWDAPGELRPERWLDGSPKARGTFLAFGGGPRICLGLQVGVQQLTVATSWLAAHVDIEVVSPARPGVPHPTHVPDGFRARLRQRVPVRNP